MIHEARRNFELRISNFEFRKGENHIGRLRR
jgi:hypothetical protein